MTRRPQKRSRTQKLITMQRLKNLSAPFEVPGLELAEVPIVGVIVLALFAIVALIVVGLLIGGFLVALIELGVILALSIGGSLWAWLRRHPKYAVLDIGDQRWVKQVDGTHSHKEDAQMVEAGHKPRDLGYQPVSMSSE